MRVADTSRGDKTMPFAFLILIASLLLTTQLPSSVLSALCIGAVPPIVAVGLRIAHLERYMK